MKPLDFESCVYCSRLCRHVHPVAVGSGREAATPTAIMTGVWRWLEGSATADEALESATLCTQCRAYEKHCTLSRPVSALPSEAIGANRESPSTPALDVHGEGSWMAVETDERRRAEAQKRHLGEPVARLISFDHTESPLLARPRALSDQLAAMSGRPIMVSSHRDLEIAGRTEIQDHHLSEHLHAPETECILPPCSGPQIEGRPLPLALSYCRAHHYLQSHHQAIASETSAAAARELGDRTQACPDSACTLQLRRYSAQVHDSIDWLLASNPEP